MRTKKEVFSFDKLPKKLRVAAKRILKDMVDRPEKYEKIGRNVRLIKGARKLSKREIEALNRSTARIRESSRALMIACKRSLERRGK